MLINEILTPEEATDPPGRSWVPCLGEYDNKLSLLVSALVTWQRKLAHNYDDIIMAQGRRKCWLKIKTAVQGLQWKEKYTWFSKNQKKWYVCFEDDYIYWRDLIKLLDYLENVCHFFRWIEWNCFINIFLLCWNVQKLYLWKVHF